MRIRAVLLVAALVDACATSRKVTFAPGSEVFRTPSGFEVEVLSVEAEDRDDIVVTTNLVNRGRRLVSFEHRNVSLDYEGRTLSTTEWADAEEWLSPGPAMRRDFVFRLGADPTPGNYRMTIAGLSSGETLVLNVRIP